MLVSANVMSFLSTPANRKWAESRCGSRQMAALIVYCAGLEDPQGAKEAWDREARRKAAHRRQARQHSRR